MFRDRGNRFELNTIDRLLTDHLKGGRNTYRVSRLSYHCDFSETLREVDTSFEGCQTSSSS